MYSSISAKKQKKVVFFIQSNARGLNTQKKLRKLSSMTTFREKKSKQNHTVQLKCA